MRTNKPGPLFLTRVYFYPFLDVEDAHMNKLGELFSALRPDQIERDNFLNAALQWSSRKEKSYKSGHPSLHSKFGECLWREKNYAQAR